MPIRVRCSHPGCGILFEVPDIYAGQKARCLGCNEVVEVPAAKAADATPGGKAMDSSSAARQLGTLKVAAAALLVAVLALCGAAYVFFKGAQEAGARANAKESRALDLERKEA